MLVGGSMRIWLYRKLMPATSLADRNFKGGLGRVVNSLRSWLAGSFDIDIISYYRNIQSMTTINSFQFYDTQ